MSDNSLFMLIRTKYHTLSSTQKSVADFVLTNSKTAMLLTIHDLADECNTSVATITRFFQKLGFSSYQVFRVKLAQEVSLQSSQSIYEDINGQDIAAYDSIREIKRKILSSIVNALNDLDSLITETDIAAVTNFICKANKILFFGVGGSSFIAQDASHKFMRLGLNVISESNDHLMYIHCTHTVSSDLLFLVSQSGESKSALECARLVKENGVRIIALTSCKTSTLAHLSDVVLLSSTKETKYHTDAMIARILQLGIIDMLYVPVVLHLGSKGIKMLNKSRLAVAITKT